MKRIALLLACLCLMGLLSGCGVSADLYFSAVPLPTAAPDAAPLPAEPTPAPTAPATATEPIAPTETAPTPRPTEASPALSGLALETLVLTEGSAVTDWPAEADALPRQLLLGAPVAGDADCLVFPNIEAGNVFYKTNTKLANARQGAILVGAMAPSVLSSRGDSVDAKLNSIALAALFAK